MLDNEELRHYQGLVTGSFIFSPDSKRYAYVAVNLSGHLTVVINGIEGKDYDSIQIVKFSPDGRKLGYVAQRDKRFYVAVDNSEGIGYVSAANLVFSPDGKHSAYAASREKSVFVVTDGVEGRNYEGLDPGTISFSSDSKHAVYTAVRSEKEKKKLFFVVDGDESREYDGGVGAPVWDSPSTLHAITIRENDVLKIQIEVPAQ